MITERFIVFRVIDQDKGLREEINGFRLLEFAEEWAEKQPFPTTIDWQKEEITRRGREILDTIADMIGFDGKGE